MGFNAMIQVVLNRIGCQVFQNCNALVIGPFVGIYVQLPFHQILLPFTVAAVPETHV